MPRITLEAEEHQRIGRTLYQVQQLMNQIELPYEKGTSVQNARRQVIDDLRRLRHELDAQAARDLDGDHEARAYYPGRGGSTF